MGKLKEIFALVVEADVAGGVSSLKQFSATARKELGESKVASSDFHQSMVTGGAKVAAAGAATLATLTALGLGARKAAGEVLGLQRVAGGSAEEMSVLRFSAQQTGVELSSLSTGLVRLSKTAASDDGAKKLAAYGIEARDAQGEIRPLYDLLGDVATAVSSLDNGAEKNDLVTSIFGRGGTALIPLLNRGADGIDLLAEKAQKLGAVMDGDTLEAARRYTAAQRDVTAAVDGLRTTVGSDVLPSLTAANELAADFLTTVAEGVQSIPATLRETVVGVAALGSGVATAGGGLVSFAGSAAEAIGGLDDMKSRLAANGTSFATLAGGAALATIAVAGFTFALTENEKQQQAGLEIFNENAEKIKASFDPDRPRAFNAQIIQTAAILAKKVEIGPLDSVDRIKDSVGLYGKGEENSNRADAQKKQIEELKAALSGLSSSEARAELEALEKQMITLGYGSEETKALLADLWEQISNGRAVDAGSEDLARYTDAVDSAAQKVVTLDQALQGLADGIDPGELTVTADALKRSTDPVFGLIDATQRLQDVNAKLAAASRTDSVEITNAYQRVADAKQALDDLLAGDGNNLEQVSPEVQIADARRRVLEANRQLVIDPKNADALTRKDEALADEERAIQRRQDLKRDAQHLALQERDARRNIADAEKNLADAKAKQGEDIEQLQIDQAKAALALQDAQLRFVDGIKTGAINVEQVGAQLQRLVDEGILPQATADLLRTKIDEITLGAAVAADGLQKFAAGLEATQKMFEPGGLGWLDPEWWKKNGPTSTPSTSSPSGRAGATGGGGGGSWGTGGNPGEVWVTGSSMVGPDRFRPIGADFQVPLTRSNFLGARGSETQAGGIVNGGDTYKIYETTSPRQTARQITNMRKRRRYDR